MAAHSSAACQRPDGATRRSLTSAHSLLERRSVSGKDSCIIHCDEVTTNALRMELELQDGCCGGVLGWEVQSSNKELR